MRIETVAFVPKLNASDSKSVASVEDILREAIKTSYFNPPIIRLDEIDSSTLVIAIGGDGTMLEAMRLAHKANAHAFGINMGNVGFLTDLNIHPLFYKDVVELLDELQNHEKEECSFPIETRMVLTSSEQHYAFNEFVVSSRYSDDVIKYHLQIGSTSAGIHRANGLIVATPTGSTAYSLSVGGALMLPTMEAMQIVPVAPIGLTSRPIIVPGRMPVTITVLSDTEWSVKADGQHVNTEGGKVIIDQAQNGVKIVHTKDWSYFKMLTDKLGWKTHG